MKIDGLGTQRTVTSVEHEKSSIVQENTSDFSAELTDQQESMSTEQLEKLLAQIDEQGARLTKTPTYDELKAYRNLVKAFVGEAVSRMYALHTQAGWDSMGRQKVYTTVRKIDKHLEEMAEKIRVGQADQLSIVASQDAIRGLLVDLYM